MRLFQQSKTSLGVIALVAATLAFALGAQAAPEEVTTGHSPGVTAQDASLNSKRLALDDVDVDALLAVMDPDAAKVAEKNSEPKAEHAPAAMATLRRAATAGDWPAAAATLRDVAHDRAERLFDAVRAESHKPIKTIARNIAARARQIPHRPIARNIVLAIACVVLVPILWRTLRGSGDLIVCIDYPAELRGTFRVRVSRSQDRSGDRISQTGDKALEAEGTFSRIRKSGLRKSRNRKSNRFEHYMVSRETTFQNLPAGHHYVFVEGFVQGVDSEEILTSHREEQEVHVQRGSVVRESFDMHPHECPVEVKVTWDKRPVNDNRVALRGEPGSMRFSRGGSARISLRPGEHTLVVGSGDRVAERTITIESFQPTTVEIDLGSRENVLFSGCPPAVEPYLLGDVPTAARALERDGQREVSHLLFARFHHERKQNESAARHYEAAGCPVEAAELRKELGQFQEAAELFLRADETERAAAMYRTAGQFVAAGEAYERAKCFDSAVECFKDADDLGRWVRALEKQGAPFDAAQVALERGDTSRAIRSLQQLTYDDPDYIDGSELLVDLYGREGHLDLAAGKIDEMIRARGADAVSTQLCDRVAERLEEAEEYDRALEMLDVLRRLDAAYPRIATRIERLRKRRSSANSEGSVAVANLADAHAFTSEFRYEVLEEVGRGGMGIVFKARDRRLERVVALKRLPDNLRNHPNAVKLFLREARSAAALNHINIVTVYDAGQEGDAYYITMELLEGSPLHDILRHRVRLSARHVAQLGVQITNGLNYAHEQRIIHRDIKTANLFFTHAKTLKIMDFGLAKMVEEVRKASTMIGGTPYYMAPEQAIGEGVDHRTDLYALGITLFELLTGKVPFTEGDVAMHHRHTPPTDPRERAEGVPDALAELVLAMLEKSPDDRPASAAEVGLRLHEIVKTLG